MKQQYNKEIKVFQKIKIIKIKTFYFYDVYRYDDIEIIYKFKLFYILLEFHLIITNFTNLKN